MKGRLIALDHWQGREAAALMVDGRLEDLLIDADRPRPGHIYRAVADRPLKGQGGMFLRTPDGSAFLRGAKGMVPGDRLLVQVTGYAEGDKAIPVTDRLLFKSRYAIVTPGAPGTNVSRRIRDEDARDEILAAAHDALAGAPLPEAAGLILRSSCETASAEDIAEDVAAMAALAAQVLADPGAEPELLVEGDGPHTLAWRDWVEPAEIDGDDGSFARHGVDEALEALLSPRVDLSGGAWMMIEPTSALVAVDINTGADGSPAAGLKANIAAFRDLPRQLRLRGLGGQIVADPAPSPKKERKQLDQVLRAGLKRETTESVLAGWTAMGLVEIQRKRDRLPLTEILR
ncbi:ribonuclease E/G [Citreimonas salinaria]|uniref:Ribonuclease, Rne/Rng family n=1 Tax=Citreimonas salinaria TaxID=321339 RepID=A0A1H3LLW9_9RHOB|nr:ribonuclease E/G [Citreimonas salinaria]SDY65432.1 ribonuclease, Rne/Rng family [Citreimonas salinaria]